MSRATIRQLFTARRSPLVIADDILRCVGRHILTARRSVPVISDDLLLAATASFAHQPPRAGPPADLLAAALATPLPRTRSPLPAVTAGFARQLSHANPPANLLAAVLPPPPPCPWSLSTVAGPGFARQSPPAGPTAAPLVDAPAAPRTPSGDRSPGRCASRDRSSLGLPCRPASTAPTWYVCYYHKLFGTAASHF